MVIMSLTLILGWMAWLIIGTAISSLSSDPQDDSWQLVWADEFDEPDINEDKWGFQLGNGCNPDVPGLCGWGNFEKQWYTNRSKNAFISDGCLIIQAEKERFEVNDYTSARMHTDGKADWQFGLFKIRFRFPEGKHIWPLIWLFPSLSKYGNWPVNGEMDIAVDDRTKDGYKILCQAIAGRDFVDRRNKAVFYGVPDGSKFTDRFHEVTVEWQPDIIKWYLNGLETSECTVRKEDIEKQGPAFIYPFNDRFHLIINVAVGGLVVGNPDTKTAFPQRLQIDYVRVYQKPYMF